MSHDSDHHSSSNHSSSLSLHSQTFIGEYGQLDFSDEDAPDDFSSHEDDYKELSKEQLKKLRVDKFPHQYAYNFDEPSTKEETYLMGNRKKQNEAPFNIDSFLNSQPVEMKGKIGKDRRRENSNRLDFMKNRKIRTIKQVSEEESLQLITLPEPPQVRKRGKGSKKKESCEDFSVRFEEAKLNFMDCFLPDGMKIKNNPYAFFKYTNSKRQRII